MKYDSPMHVALRQIPAEGLDLDFELDQELLHQALAGTETDPPSAHVRARLNLQRTGQDVYVKGGLKGRLELACSRCTVPAGFDVEAPFALTFIPAAEAGEDDRTGEVELAAGDLDV